LFEWLFAWVFFESGVSEAVASFVQRLPPRFTAFIGIKGGTSQFATQMLAFGYAHPVIIISLAFMQISIPARYIAGEIEFKTFDILLTKPIKRFIIPLSKAIGLFVFLYFFDTIIKLSKSLENFSSYSYFQLYQPGKIVQNQADATSCILISLSITALFFIYMKVISTFKE